MEEKHESPNGPSSIPIGKVSLSRPCCTRWTMTPTSLDMSSPSVMVATRRIYRLPTCWEEKPGWPSSTKGNRWLPNMVGLRDCWYLISTSGRVPSGSGASDWSSGMNRASGSQMATTIMVIRGKNSATGATNLAAGVSSREEDARQNTSFEAECVAFV